MVIAATKTGDGKLEMWVRSADTIPSVGRAIHADTRFFFVPCFTRANTNQKLHVRFTMHDNPLDDEDTTACGFAYGQDIADPDDFWKKHGNVCKRCCQEIERFQREYDESQ